MYGKCKVYGKKCKLKRVLGKLKKRRGYVSVGVSQGIKKELRKFAK